MKSIKYFSLLLVLLIASKITAQEFKLGKVSIDELTEKVHPKDSAAPAAILYKKGYTRIEFDPNDGFVTSTEVETRIKIYKKEGYNWANQAVWYYSYSGLSEKVFISDAVTYNLVGGKIEKVKLKSDGIFDENINKYRNQKKITMPNVKEGSVIEFKYTIRSSSDGMIREWDFQSSIPVNFSEFKTFVPEFYVFNSRQKGYVFPKVVSEKVSKSVVFTSKNRSDGGAYIGPRTSDKFDYFETQTTYTGVNLPAMKEEAYVNNIDNYTSSVQHELAMIKFPNRPIKPFSTDWNSVVKTIYNYTDFGPELNKTGYFENDLKVLLEGKKTSEERISAIFNHVKNSVKWNDYHGYSCDNGVKKAYKEKTGNTADINLMLTAMLRYDGIIANPVLVSTRSNGISLFPNRNAFNYVIVAVETADGNILLDASDKFSIPNILPFRALNWMGRLIRKDGTSEEVDLMPKKPSNDVVFMSYSIDPDGKLSGKIRRQYTDYNAMVFRNKVDNVKEDSYLEKLENDNDKIEISEYKRTNEKELELPTVETFSFTGSNLCEVIGEKIYINPMLFYTEKENPFKQEEREYPVDYGFPSSDKYSITIQIPDGYTVESLPEPIAIAMEDNLGMFKFIVAASQNTLQLVITHQIDAAIIPVGHYSMLQEYYKGMIAKMNEKIVLKRI
jgi:transglutaminase-like putative cysteine protease